MNESGDMILQVLKAAQEFINQIMDEDNADILSHIERNNPVAESFESLMMSLVRLHCKKVPETHIPMGPNQ